MFMVFAVVGILSYPPSDSLPTIVTGPRDVPAGVTYPAPADSTPRRRKAFEISDAYQTRLTIHRYASYATLPLFAAQAIAGERLYTDDAQGKVPSSLLKDVHGSLAVAVGALFAVNTVTGSLNWWETRHQPGGRAWRTVHAALMLVADGGFAYAATLGNRARFTQADRDLHKNWAIGSASVALASYVMMLSPIRRD